MAEEVKTRTMTDCEYERILTKVSLVCASMIALFWWVWSWFANVPVYQNVIATLIFMPYLLDGWSRWWDVPVVFLLINIFGWVARLLYVAGSSIYSARENIIIGFLFLWPCLIVGLSAMLPLLFLFTSAGPLYGVVLGGVLGLVFTTLSLGMLFLVGLLLDVGKEVYGLSALLIRGLWNWLQQSEAKS